MFRNARVIVTALSTQQPETKEYNTVIRIHLEKAFIAHLSSLLDKNQILSLSYFWILPVTVAKGYATRTCVAQVFMHSYLILCNQKCKSNKEHKYFHITMV